MKNNNKYTFRKLMNDLHLWLGIASSLVLFVVCLTGTIYTFKKEIETFIEPTRYNVVSIAEEAKPLAELQQIVQQSVDGKIERVTISNDKSKTYIFTVGGKGKGKSLE